MKSTWSVFVVYENAPAREKAVEFCDQLVERFWAKFGFEVDWMGFDALQDSSAAQPAIQTAARADLLLYAIGAGSGLPLQARAWTERWLAARGEREGALVGLTVGKPDLKTTSPAAYSYLLKAAHRAGMDFLTSVPQSIPGTISESVDFYPKRAHQLTSVLDDILHQPAPPPS